MNLFFLIAILLCFFGENSNIMQEVQKKKKIKGEREILIADANLDLSAHVLIPQGLIFTCVVTS